MKTNLLHSHLMMFPLVIGLAACGGGDSDAGPPVSAGGGGPFSPASCGPDRYLVTLSSSSALVSDEPRIMRALINCGGNVVVVPNVAIDWTVTSGGGSVNGNTTVRTMTGANGISEVSWRFGSLNEVQSIEARLNGISPPLHASLSHAVVSAGPNACEAVGGTDLGGSRTVSADETWTKAGSPYFTQCPASTPCSGEVAVSSGAVLTIEPGVAVCVNKISVADAGRILAAGTAAERIHFGVRNRASQWDGLVFQPPASTGTLSGASVLKNTVIENPLIVDVGAHPILVEDTLIRRDSSVSRGPDPSGAGVGGCARFTISQHRLAGIPPSRVVRTIIDGLGSTPGYWDYDYGCPSLAIVIPDGTPLVVSARVINSWGPGVGVFLTSDASQTLLTDCEISGSAGVGLFFGVDEGLALLPRMTSCNVFGNAFEGVVNGGSSSTNSFDARGNWWGDAAGPQGQNGDGVSGKVDASNPLALPRNLGY